MNPKTTVIYTLLGTALLVAVDQVAVKHEAPQPHNFLAAGILWIGMSFFVDKWPKPIATLSVGVFVLAAVHYLPEVLPTLGSVRSSSDRPLPTTRNPKGGPAK